MYIVIALKIKISAIFILVNETSLLFNSWNSCVFLGDFPQIVFFVVVVVFFVVFFVCLFVFFRNGSLSLSTITAPMPPSLNWS